MYDGQHDILGTMAQVICVLCEREFGPKNYNSRLCRYCALHNKWCSDCQSALPREYFTSDMQRRCADCARQYAYAYRKGLSKEDKILASRLRAARRCGISLAEYNQIYADQDGICLICQQADATDLDHCTITNSVRGLLCGKCNKGLGLFDDDIVFLSRAIAYLKGEL